jgi:predicted dehydrogenase
VSETVTVALVGFGRWAPNVYRDLLELGCRVPVVARSEATAARALAAGAETVVSRIPALRSVDGVVVATSLDSHFAVTEEALGLGVPVFVEKPLTASVAEAEHLCALAPDRLFVMEKWRYHPAIEALRELVLSGELGDPVGIVTVRDGRGDFRFDVDTIWTHVPHDISLSYEILGTLPPARHALAELVNGVPVGLQAALVGDGGPWVTVSHSTTAPVRRREVRVCLSGGTAWLADGYDDHISVASGLPGKGEPDSRPTPGEWPLLRELRAFVEHLDGGPPPRSSAAEGAMTVRRIAELRALAGLDG